jgi:hypothetical protein
VFAGTQLRGKERAQPLLVASVVMAIFFFGRFWASPVKEVFPSGILAALRYVVHMIQSNCSGVGVYKYGSIVMG